MIQNFLLNTHQIRRNRLHDKTPFLYRRRWLSEQCTTVPQRHMPSPPKRLRQSFGLTCTENHTFKHVLPNKKELNQQKCLRNFGNDSAHTPTGGTVCWNGLGLLKEIMWRKTIQRFLGLDIDHVSQGWTDWVGHLLRFFKEANFYSMVLYFLRERSFGALRQGLLLLLKIKKKTQG